MHKHLFLLDQHKIRSINYVCMF